MRTLMLMVGFAALSIGFVAAQSDEPLPPNTIKCAAFTKRPDGSWYVEKPTTFDFGSMKAVTISDEVIGPHTVSIDRFDFYDVLERKCGRR